MKCGQYQYLWAVNRQLIKHVKSVHKNLVLELEHLLLLQGDLQDLLVLVRIQAHTAAAIRCGTTTLWLLNIMQLPGARSQDQPGARSQEQPVLVYNVHIRSWPIDLYKGELCLERTV